MTASGNGRKGARTQMRRAGFLAGLMVACGLVLARGAHAQGTDIDGVMYPALVRADLEACRPELERLQADAAGFLRVRKDAQRPGEADYRADDRENVAAQDAVDLFVEGFCADEDWCVGNLDALNTVPADGRAGQEVVSMYINLANGLDASGGALPPAEAPLPGEFMIDPNPAYACVARVYLDKYVALNPGLGLADPYAGDPEAQVEIYLDPDTGAPVPYIRVRPQ